MLFQGEEWGASAPFQFFTSHPEPELAAATAEGRVNEFAKMGWDPATVPDPQDPATYERSRLDWSEREEGVHARLLARYRQLVALRRTLPALTDPSFGSTACRVEGPLFTMRRGSLLVAVNTGDTSVDLPGPAELLFATGAGVTLSGTGLTLPPHAGALVR
jgi:maltooligosyltrehalose trehalohydrolase